MFCKRGLFVIPPGSCSPRHNYPLVSSAAKIIISLLLNYNLQSLGRSLGETYFLLVIDLGLKGNDWIVIVPQ